MPDGKLEQITGEEFVEKININPLHFSDKVLEVVGDVVFSAKSYGEIDVGHINFKNKIYLGESRIDHIRLNDSAIPHLDCGEARIGFVAGDFNLVIGEVHCQESYIDCWHVLCKSISGFYAENAQIKTLCLMGDINDFYGGTAKIDSFICGASCNFSQMLNFQDSEIEDFMLSDKGTDRYDGTRFERVIADNHPILGLYIGFFQQTNVEIQYTDFKMQFHR